MTDKKISLQILFLTELLNKNIIDNNIYNLALEKIKEKERTNHE